ncbi:hypothetical protein DIPPA_10918 [Diplonema papillatum]|nr:hypothetical protein DIPPA_10918 [Diplonema papillatum]
MGQPHTTSTQTTARRAVIVAMLIALMTCMALTSWSRPPPLQAVRIVLPAEMNLFDPHLHFDTVTQSHAHLASLGIRVKPREEWFLGVCSGTKSSGIWLREWLELQLVAGVDHVWLVNDNDAETEDGTAAMMEFYEALGFLTIIPGRMPSTHPGCRQPPGVHPESQISCAVPKYCAEQVGDQVKWMLFMDTDEFAFPRVGCSLSDYVRNTCDPNSAEILVRWERFGTSGFDAQPAGLMTETFLSSGGDCSQLSHRSYRQDLEFCKKNPYNYCRECRHTKVVINTQCATVDHVGWMHCLVNTTEWKHGRWSYRAKRFLSNPGKEALPFKNKMCHHVDSNTANQQCLGWLKTQTGKDRKREYEQSCCSAGIGYNHYGTKAAQFYWRKQARQKEDVRGYRTDLEHIDLNGFVSTSILRFVRVLRKRMIFLGSPLSVATQFLEVEIDGSTNGTCFQEVGYSYAATEQSNVSTHTFTRRVPDDAEPGAFCCAACWRLEGCTSWTVLNNECTLLAPNARTVHEDTGERDYPWSLPQLTQAARSVDHSALSGHIVPDECYPPS